MVDINPQDTVNKYAPRQTDLVDAAAEANRIAAQALRSNPLKNAIVDSGLTRWTGNYGGDLLWVGEFFPPDANLVDDFGNLKPQRGVSLVRDDPKHGSALSLYDGSPVAGEPLAQTLTMSDGNGRRLLQEAFNQKGRRYPDKAIPMYARISVDTGGNASSDEIAWMGSGNLIGTHVDFNSSWTVGGGTAGINGFLRVNGVGGTTVNSSAFSGTGANGSFNVTLDCSAIYDNGEDFITVEWHIWRFSGTNLYYPRVTRCRNFTDN